MERRTYLVRKGDSLEHLTTYFGVKRDVLFAANPQVDSAQLLTPGTFISLPASSNEAVARTASLHAYIASLAGGTEPPWLQTARREVGQHEIAGSPSNPRIVEYMHAVTTLHSPDDDTDETPWCACFMQWVLAQVGIAGTNNAWALSYKRWGVEEPAANPRIGSIAVFKRPGGGHVGFYTGQAGTGRIKVLGGNEGNAVKEESYPTNAGGYILQGYRWPAGA